MNKEQVLNTAVKLSLVAAYAIGTSNPEGLVFTKPQGLEEVEQDQDLIKNIVLGKLRNKNIHLENEKPFYFNPNSELALLDEDNVEDSGKKIADIVVRNVGFIKNKVLPTVTDFIETVDEALAGSKLLVDPTSNIIITYVNIPTFIRNFIDKNLIYKNETKVEVSNYKAEAITKQKLINAVKKKFDYDFAVIEEFLNSVSEEEITSLNKILKNLSSDNEYFLSGFNVSLRNFRTNILLWLAVSTEVLDGNVSLQTLERINTNIAMYIGNNIIKQIKLLEDFKVIKAPVVDYIDNENIYIHKEVFDEVKSILSLDVILGSAYDGKQGLSADSIKNNMDKYREVFQNYVAAKKISNQTELVGKFRGELVNYLKINFLDKEEDSYLGIKTDIFKERVLKDAFIYIDSINENITVKEAVEHIVFTLLTPESNAGEFVKAFDKYEQFIKDSIKIDEMSEKFRNKVALFTSLHLAIEYIANSITVEK